MKKENWIKWDLDSRLGLKMSEFFADHGAAGYGFFLILVEQLYRADGNRLKLESMQRYANRCKIMQTEGARMIDDMVSTGLMCSDGEWVWSERVFEEVELRRIAAEQLSVKRTAAANARWEKHRATSTTNMQTDATPCKPMQTYANDARLEEIRSNTSTSTRVSNVVYESKTEDDSDRVDADDYERFKRDMLGVGKRA